MRQLLLILVTVLVLSIGVVAFGTNQQRVGNIRSKKIADGCGCYLQFPGTKRQSEKYVFFSSIEDSDEREAWMNLDGKDVKLYLRRKSDPKGKERIGSVSNRRYVARGIVVDATYVATSVCRVDDESCEFTGYAATFKVTVQGRSQMLKAVGGCGC